MIRFLKPNEVECRVQQINEKGCTLLIYKDARVDMSILDEVYGIDGWQRTHEVINGNLFCTVEIWSEKTKTWVKKQDVGVESKTEHEKGQASDSFKRACFNIGIGRELYSSPFIWINLDASELSDYNGKKQLKKGVYFSVNHISCNADKEIDSLIIVDNKGVIRFSYGNKFIQKTEEVLKESLKELQLSISQEEVKKVWEKYPTLHTNATFKKEVTNAKNKYDASNNSN